MKKRELHGMWGTRICKRYYNILARCTCKTTKNYDRYGGRGIKCEWKSFEEFKNDMYESFLEHVKLYGEKNTTIERINSNGNYCKENCRRATIKEQNTNKCNTIHFEYKGKKYNCLKKACEELGLKYGTVKSRIRQYGYSIEDALSFKPHDSKRKINNHFGSVNNMVSSSNG